MPYQGDRLTTAAVDAGIGQQVERSSHITKDHNLVTIQDSPPSCNAMNSWTFPLHCRELRGMHIKQDTIPDNKSKFEIDKLKCNTDGEITYKTLS
jgi:hypothetical protein